MANPSLPQKFSYNNLSVGLNYAYFGYLFFVHRLVGTAIAARRLWKPAAIVRYALLMPTDLKLEMPTRFDWVGVDEKIDHSIGGHLGEGTS